MIDTYPCEDRDALVDYLYDEMDAGRRRAFEAHLDACAACAGEIHAMRAVRADLGTWTVPEPEPGVGLPAQARVVALPVARQPAWDWTRPPAWARTAAALVALGLGLGLANVRVESGADGVRVTTGWLAPPASTAPAADAAAGGAEAWRPDLAALEADLRREMHELSARPTPVAVSDGAGATGGTALEGAALARVQALIEASERRQRQELALRLTQFGHDVETRRREDIVRIEQGFGRFEGRTGAEVARQRQLLDYLVRVSTRQVP